MVRGGIWQFVNDTNRPAFLETDLVELCVNGNWQVWVSMSTGGVSEVSVGPASGLLQDQEPIGVASLWGVETLVNNELVEVGRFSEGDRGGFGKVVLGRWIGIADMGTFPEDSYEMVKARIVGGGERQVMGV